MLVSCESWHGADKQGRFEIRLNGLDRFNEFDDISVALYFGTLRESIELFTHIMKGKVGHLDSSDPQDPNDKI